MYRLTPSGGLGHFSSKTGKEGEAGNRGGNPWGKKGGKKSSGNSPSGGRGRNYMHVVNKGNAFTMEEGGDKRKKIEEVRETGTKGKLMCFHEKGKKTYREKSVSGEGRQRFTLNSHPKEKLGQ